MSSDESACAGPVVPCTTVVSTRRLGRRCNVPPSIFHRDGSEPLEGVVTKTAGAGLVWIYFFADRAAYRFWVIDALEWLAPTGTDSHREFAAFCRAAGLRFPSDTPAPFEGAAIEPALAPEPAPSATYFPARTQSPSRQAAQKHGGARATSPPRMKTTAPAATRLGDLLLVA